MTMRSTSILLMVAVSSRGLAFAFNIAQLISLPSTFVRRGPLLSSRHLQGATTIHRCSSLHLSSDIILTNSVVFLETMDRSSAESLAGPFFGASLFPYLGFLYFLDYPGNGTPKGVTIGFATCLLFVLLTIPAAIGAQVGYGVSLADCDFLHGSAESLLTITNLVTTLSFKSAVDYEVRRRNKEEDVKLPESYNRYRPMINVVIVSTLLAFLTALYPIIATTGGANTPYLGGFLDVLPPSSFLPPSWTPIHSEPKNALTVGTWIIHISSLVEFLVAMGYCWKWSDISNNMRWRGLTWGLLPLHTSGITAITYHLLYNSLPVLVPLQAALTLFGNSTAMYAAYRLAVSNGWTFPSSWRSFLGEIPFLPGFDDAERRGEVENTLIWRKTIEVEVGTRQSPFTSSLAGFEDLGDALAGDNNYLFVVKLLVGCAIVR